MVKGVSKQVIVVDSPDKELFDQAIFILKDGKKEVTDEALLRQAKALLHKKDGNRTAFSNRLVWTMIGAACTGVLWLISMLF